MREFSDRGFIVDVRRYGEHDAVVSFFTENHGLLKAFVNHAFSKKMTGVVQVGNLTAISYRARLEDQLGNAACDLVCSYAGRVMQNPDALSVLSCLCALLTFLPQDVPAPQIFNSALAQAEKIGDSGVFERYARFELLLLSEMGFGLDLSCCAATGATENLTYVSPKSARAVSFEAGAPWKDRLLPLPAFLLDGTITGVNFAEIKKALVLTGFFLENYACKHINCGFPPVRRRLFERVAAK